MWNGNVEEFDKTSVLNLNTQNIFDNNRSTDFKHATLNGVTTANVDQQLETLAIVGYIECSHVMEKQ